MKTLKNMTGDSLEQLIDYKVVDQNGDSIGTLHSLWSDPTTGGVEFLGVKTGWLFGKNHVVPAGKAELDDEGDVVRLPYTTIFVKEAPAISADAEITEEEEIEIYRYYGMERPAAVETTGSRWRKTARTEPVGGVEIGEPAKSALDDLVPGDSSSTTTTGSKTAPESYGTSNLYGSTGTTTPVAADSAGAPEE